MQIGSFELSPSANGIPGPPLDADRYVPPVYHPDKSQTWTWRYVAPDVPYGLYGGYTVWVSDMQGNDTVTTLAPITIHDPAHPIDNQATINGKQAVGSTLSGSITSVPGATTTYTWANPRYFHRYGDSVVLNDWDYKQTISLFSETVFPDGTRRVRRAESEPIGLGTITPRAPKLAVPVSGRSAQADYDHVSDLFVWGGYASTSVQWFLDGTEVAGATADAYTPKPADIGKKLHFRVTTSTDSPFYDQGPLVLSSPAQVVVPATLSATKLEIRPMPDPEMYHYIVRTISAKTGTWTKGTTLSYQWTRDGKAIKGATKNSYALAPADHKKRIGITVTGKQTGYRTKAVSSATVKPILRTVSVPRINTAGDHRPGHTVKVVRDGAGSGSWTKGTTLTYQWYRSGKAIKDATKVSYRIRNADLYEILKVVVTGKKYGYNTGTASRSVKLRWR